MIAIISQYLWEINRFISSIFLIMLTLFKLCITLFLRNLHSWHKEWHHATEGWTKHWKGLCSLRTGWWEKSSWSGMNFNTFLSKFDPLHSNIRVHILLFCSLYISLTTQRLDPNSPRFFTPPLLSRRLLSRSVLFTKQQSINLHGSWILQNHFGSLQPYLFLQAE